MTINLGSPGENPDSGIYGSGMEQISEYMKVLDVMLQIELIKFQSAANNDFEQFKGLVIRYDEVCGLLDGSRKETHEMKEIVYLRKQISVFEESIKAKSAAAREKGRTMALEDLCEAFNLTSFEKYVLILSIAVELDTKYEKIFGFLLDDITIKRPTVGLACRILLMNNEKPHEYRHFFSEGSLLDEFFLLKDNANSKTGLLSTELRVEKRILSFLTGSSRIDGSIEAFASLTDAGDGLEPMFLNEGIHQKIIRYTAHEFPDKSVIFNLWGPAGAGRTFQIRHLCGYLNKPLLTIDAGVFLEEEVSLNRLISGIIRETIISKSVLCFKGMDMLSDGGSSPESLTRNTKLDRVLYEILRRTASNKLIVFILSESELNFERSGMGPLVITIKLEIPGTGERKRLWEYFGSGCSFDGPVDWGIMSSKFRITPGQIKDVFIRANKMASWHFSDDHCIRVNELNQACHDIGNRKMNRKAVRINPGYTWEDIVLPPAPKEQLRNACNQIKYRHIVFGEWGFENKLSYGKGLSVLFSGPPGTGKTMSAQVIAKELELELYRVDISQLVSKYIGETEKNIQEVFYWAQTSNAILFFDEADALFGKRSEVKDSHDRYSNIETAFLLQKIEEYEGVSILATNYVKNIDEAFMRRFNYVVEFPFPDADLRLNIWRRVFPKETPVDREVDFGFIAEKFEVSGGNIKNIALSAAFLAVECGEPVRMKHIVRAAKDELNKTGKIFSSSGFEDYYDEN